MHELIKTIKQAACEAVESSKPVNIIIGKVTQDDSLKIRISQKLTLDADFLLLPEHLKNMELKKGDGVVLLREQGGQRFLVIGKI